MSALKACIIGTGRIASSLEKDPLRPLGSSHAGLYALHREVELVAGADIDPVALAAFGADWSIPSERLFADYRVMLEELQPDLVSVCAYAPERAEMALVAIASGAKGLWLEKAVGCSIHDGETIQRAATAAEVQAVVDYPRRGRAHYRRIKQLIDEQTFGRLQTVTCHMTHQLIHTGTHAYDVLRYWCGEAVSVSGRLENPPPADDNIADQGGTAEIVFDSGATAFVSALRKRYYIFQFDLVFDDARILVGNDIAKVYRPATSKLYTGFRELFETPDFDWGPSYERDMVGELIHAIETGRQPIFSLQNAIESLRIALAIFASAQQSSRPIAPTEVDPNLRVESV